VTEVDILVSASRGDCHDGQRQALQLTGLCGERCLLEGGGGEDAGVSVCEDLVGCRRSLLCRARGERGLGFVDFHTVQLASRKRNIRACLYAEVQSEVFFKLKDDGGFRPVLVFECGADGGVCHDWSEAFRGHPEG
jgi:hypothetical protein